MKTWSIDYLNEQAKEKIDNFSALADNIPYESKGILFQEAFFAYFVQSGLGGKYQLIPGLMELELLYTNFWAGSEGEGAGQTYNLGIRFIQGD